MQSKRKTETICGADLKPQKWRSQWKMAEGATILLSKMKSWLLLILKYLVSSLFSNCGKPLFHLYLEVVPQVCTKCSLSSCRCLSRVGRASVHLWSWWQTASCPLTAILRFSSLLCWFGCTGSSLRHAGSFLAVHRLSSCVWGPSCSAECGTLFLNWGSDPHLLLDS